MTRGIPHPENLKPVQTADEAREKGRLGGIASGKARKRRALYREILQDIMAQPIKVPFQDGLLCADEAICLAQVRKAAVEGDDGGFEQMAFTLSHSQAEKVKEALKKAQKSKEFKFCDKEVNSNKNANALFCIVEAYLHER